MTEISHQEKQASEGLENSAFLQACLGKKAAYTPVWFMRQAGRYMPEYRKIRQQHSMLDAIGNPDLAAEITLQPMNAFDLDAAIIFSDILPPLAAMGFDLDFVKGSGPQISNPIATTSDVSRLTVSAVGAHMEATVKAVGIVSAELTARGLPLIGFAGAPFTLACYAIQGSGSKSFDKARAFMMSEPESWHSLMGKLVEVQARYLLMQADAGASALQIFDSWAGALSRSDYVKFVQPHNKSLFEALQPAKVPVVNFSTGTSPFLEEVVACGGDVIGVDWRLPLAESWAKIGSKPIQGNLDPVALLAPWAELELRANEVLDSAAGRPGHIFNLGHGILPSTSTDIVRRLVDHIHETTRQS